jgi:hypothetical protein
MRPLALMDLNLKNNILGIPNGEVAAPQQSHC